MDNGNIIKVSHGAYTETAKGQYEVKAQNINTNAAGKITENGKDGVKYDKAPPRQGTKDEMMNITVGMFFDGTYNNKNNNERRTSNQSNSDDTSYQNDSSNVQKLETAYAHETQYFSIYIEGVGTKNDETDYPYDAALGGGFGDHGTGIQDKVRSGCKSLAERLARVAGKKKINVLTVDVFGFSRGSTCARNFIHEITLPAQSAELTKNPAPAKDYSYTSADDSTRTVKPANKPAKTIQLPARGALGQYLKDNNVTCKTIALRFGGLFDSVSAFGIMHRNDVSELDLNAIDKMLHVVHLTAGDEHRDQFELTAVHSGITKTFPGVHSDIGGGYRDQITDTTILNNDKIETAIIDRDTTDENITDASLIQKYTKLKKYYVEQGWYKDEQLSIKAKPSGKQKSESLVGVRKISNKYSLIPLHLMAEFGVKNGKVKINQDDLKNSYKIPSNDPALNLNDVYTRLHGYAFNQEAPLTFHTADELGKLKAKTPAKKYDQLVNDHKMLMQLRNRYLHNSSSYASIASKPTSDGVRVIYNQD